MNWLFVLALLARCDQDPAESARVASLGQPVLECVVTQARGLEKSGEPAESVATAAVTTCNPLVEAFRVTVAKCSDQVFANNLVTDIKRMSREAAITAVVRMRAER